jgi:hypothetical protein
MAPWHMDGGFFHSLRKTRYQLVEGTVVIVDVEGFCGLGAWLHGRPDYCDRSQSDLRRDVAELGKLLRASTRA